MKMLRPLIALVAFGVIALVLSGCSDGNSADGAATADEQFAEGISHIEDSIGNVNLDVPPWEWDVDMEEAHGYFADALDADPDHCGALLMAAITRLAVILQDPDLVNIIEGLFPEEGRGPGGAGDFLFRVLQRPDFYNLAERMGESYRDDFPFSELQEFIEAEVLPALDYADGNLEQFEDQDCVVLLHINVEEQRETVEIEIDATDAYLLHVPLDVLQAVFYIVVSYNVDMEEGQSFQELIDEDPDFLSLRPGDNMAAAYAELIETHFHLSECAWSLGHETDPQDTDIFTNTDDEGWIPLGEGFADTLSAIADEIYDGMQAGVSFNPADDLDPEAPDIDILLDLEELFMDPLDPITYYFPAHTWLDSMTMDVTRPIDFPDPTFSNITPGMTNVDWGEIIDWIDP